MDWICVHAERRNLVAQLTHRLSHPVTPASQTGGMSEHTLPSARAVVVNLAEYRAARRRAQTHPTLPAIRRRAPLRLPTPAEVQHRHRMLEHLAADGAAAPSR